MKVGDFGITDARPNGGLENCELKFSIIHLFQLAAAFGLMFAFCRWSFIMAAGLSPITFGLISARASSSNLSARIHGVSSSVLWTLYSLTLASPFVIMCWFAGLDLVCAALFLTVSVLTSLLTGSRGAIASDRNRALREAIDKQT